MKLKGTYHEMAIPEDREIVETDKKTYPWEEDPAGYFLIKVEDKMIKVGFLESHVMVYELVGTDPFNLIKEVAKRSTLNLQHMGYIAAEIMRAYQHLVKGTRFVQR